MNKQLTLNNIDIVLEDKIIKNGSLTIENNKIIKIENTNSDIINDFKGYKIIPGFIDGHTHGGYGYDLDTLKDTNSYNQLSLKMASEGVTQACLGTVTQPFEDIKNSINIFNNYKNTKDYSGTEFLGLHIEGPFISAEKKGAHKLSLLKKGNKENWNNIFKNNFHNITYLTYAPEVVDEDFIQLNKDNNIILSMGHSNILYDELNHKNIASKHVTHIFNGMSGVNQHTPGLATYALNKEEVIAELICDGFHVKQPIVELIYKMKGYKKIHLITDSMVAKGLPNGNYKLGQLNVVKDDYTARLADGEAAGTLAGSVAKFDQCYRNIKKFTKCGDIEAIHMSSINIAKELNIYHETGSIALDKKANLTILNQKDEVILTIVNNKIVYNKYEKELIWK